MYQRSSKHNFPHAEFNLGRMLESDNKIKESIEYFIRASDHENEPLTYRKITRDDKRLKISRKFIICLTNFKLFVYYFSINDHVESKKYFIRAFNSLIVNTKDLIYQFNFKFIIQQENETNEEYSNNVFSYLKKFIFNFPLFNLINQSDLYLKSYSNIFENQIETKNPDKIIEERKKSFTSKQEKNISTVKEEKYSKNDDKKMICMTK